MASWLLKIRRGETPFYRGIRKFARRVESSRLPLPHFFNPFLGFCYNAWQTASVGLHWLCSYFFVEPLFRGRCASVGKRLRVWRLPFILGHAKIYIGDDVNIFGKIDIFSGRLFDEPKLIIGNRVDLGHNVLFLVNKEIVLEDDINVASGVRFMDTDAHPRDAMERIADLPPHEDEVKPVRIGRRAWIGHNVFIMKGVTIGEGAIIGVNSVVVNDIPPYCVAMGNPARVVVKNTKQAVAAAPAPSLQEQRSE
jgi:acetyltransferase-like isoleucine patch superfamily enzyme